MAEPRISVVIPTYQRPATCAAAVESALAQTLAPLEVLVCDDGSGDETPRRFGDWEREDERVRYLRLPHSGRPAPGRNAGVRAARGDWVAFLDDDDRWRPGKLEIQAPHLSDGLVLGTNARRSSGTDYFADMTEPLAPTPESMLRVNPLITSTTIAGRDAVLGAGGFHEAAWARGVEDFALWLAMLDRGARFLVLPDVTADYHDEEGGRLSDRVARQEWAVARLAWQRWARRPPDVRRLRVAASHSVAAGRASRRRG